MKPISVLTFCLLTATQVLGQNPELVKDLEFAIHIHDTASVFESEIEATAAFEKVCEKFPENWRPFYWTAYMYTQIGRAVDILKRNEDPMSFIDEAQAYFDKAAARLSNKTSGEQSDFQALQSLIYLFKARFSEDETSQNIFKAAGQDALNQAIQANPENPLVYVLTGTALIGEGTGEKNMADILAGRVLLKEAQKKFEAARPERSLTLHWNREWLPFWLPYTEKLLKGKNGGGRANGQE
ncbi:hypothetical protein GWO43_08005 [candidate division KSB1 bacterium]|nr:hypothetical protein [candidate division KSB1 bacterium]NIS23913.1 hypothetical protein [candidate division KSB1 bacterium]NIT70830.1 hypothetical protein [candidate division KSB1 bacterium]NIU24562.1 hypothetical protein [candidate division KSB1 bacterium]NIU94516.1 hypothetical protein [candidate division KSB1 bacterium]